MKNIWNVSRLIFHLLVAFVSSLAPLMFLVGVIAGLDRWGAHNRFVDNLEAYGKTAEATVSYIDEEYNRVGVDFVDAFGEENYGTLDLRYYSPEVVETIKPRSTVQVIYIDALVSEHEKTALLEYYEDVKKAPPVTADIWWMLFISLLIIAFKPQFVFLGMVDFNTLLGSALSMKE